MVEQHARKLAVILHADVVGSTSLVQKNESLAHARIQDAFRRFSSIIESYNGMTHELRGDALLAEFARASDAVGAALTFQKDNAESNARLEDELKPQLRIGISLGEVVIADNTVTGAGVVLAQRIEQLAEPDGVCITGAVHEAVPQHLGLNYADLGKRDAKGFDEPVQVYSASVGVGEQPPPPEAGISVAAQSRKPKRLWTAGAITLLIVAVGALGWFYLDQPDVELASVENMSFPLPKEPSIAVLPFDNLSGDEAQDFLVDGLTENIIATLAESPYLFVIARNSTFVYKGKPVSVKQVAEELGVRHVLEGSVQREGERIRITAQLIDALTGRHIWAERYDREFKDILALQDEITEKIMVALHVEITEGTDYDVMHTRVESPEAFELLMRARTLALRDNREDAAIARELVARAAAIEPDNPEIWLYQAWGHWRQYQNRWSDDRQASLDKAVELGEKAYAADPNYSAAVGFLGVLSLSRGRHEEAIAYGRKSVELAPSSALDNARLAWFLEVAGHPDEAITLVQKAMRLSPSYPAWFTAVLAFAYMLTEDYEKAITAYEQMVERNHGLLRAYTRLAGMHAVLGNDEKASEYVAKVLKTKPEFTVQGWKQSVWYQDPKDLERELNMLRKAGLPEGGDSSSLPERTRVSLWIDSGSRSIWLSGHSEQTSS